MRMMNAMTWHDMTWWCDMIWYDMIWYGIMIWYNMIWYDKIWYDALLWTVRTVIRRTLPSDCLHCHQTVRTAIRLTVFVLPSDCLHCHQTVCTAIGLSALSSDGAHCHHTIGLSALPSEWVSFQLLCCIRLTYVLFSVFIIVTYCCIVVWAVYYLLAGNRCLF